MLKGSKDSASLVVCNETIFLVGVCGFFMSDIISGGLLSHLGPLHLALGPTPMMGSISLNTFRAGVRYIHTLQSA